MKTLENKLIVYDSNCKVCSSLKDLVLKCTSVPAEKVVAFSNLTDQFASLVDTNQFKNGMTLLDQTGEKTIYGSEGVAYIFASQYKSIELLFRNKSVLRLFTFFYKTIAYNRYIIATSKSRFECDCHPDRVLKYRLAYIAITFVASIILTALFGISLRKFFTDVDVAESALQMLLIAGSGWVIQILLAISLMRQHALDYVGHLGSIMVVGLLVLVPWMLLYSATGTLNPYIPAVSVLVSSSLMLYLHHHRTNRLDLPISWTISWFALLQTFALFWIYTFYFN